MNWEKQELESLDAPNLLQSGFWGAFKSCFGWDALALKSNEGASVLVMFKSLVAGATLAYVPHPFYGYEPDYTLIRELGTAIKIMRDKSPIFVRMDSLWEEEPDKSIGLIKSPVDIQPPDTVVLDIRASEDSLLAAMHKKTRYNIRLAEKKGIRVEILPYKSNINLWFELYRETSVRDKISIHSADYYKKLFELSETWPGKSPELFLLGAFYNNKLLAGNIVSFYGDTATYLYGASSNEHRNLMPTYLLQWQAIKMAKEAGLSYYDLYGIPPEPDPAHPMYGLYRFKTGFGGRIVRRAGCYDLPVKKTGYTIYKLAENARQLYHKRIKKMFRR